MQRLCTNTITDMATIHIDQELIKQARQHAESKGVNLDGLIEFYLRHFLQTPSTPLEVPEDALVANIGVDAHLPHGFDERKAYHEHILSKID